MKSSHPGAERPETTPRPIPEVLAYADAYLQRKQVERALKPAPLLQAPAQALHSIWRFLKAVGEIKAREQMAIEARRLQASRPELAAALRRASRDLWHSA